MALEGNGGSPIRTPDQRLRVFVSSTLAELAEERAAVARAITSLGLSPVMFELGARPHPPQELYRAYLAQSDVFVGLYWQSYGWVGPGMEISGLEDEFRLSSGRPRLLYLKAPAPDRQPELSAMIDQIRAAGADAYRTFRSSRELGRLVRDDLALLLSERFAQSAGSPRPREPAEATLRRSLPVPSTSLIGRDDDIDEVVRMLQSPEIRLVTLSGPGGIGKTRLAIAVAEALERTHPADRTPEVVTFVPLATIADASEVLPRIATAVGVVMEGTRSVRDALVDHFGSDSALLVLDNLEQVAGVAPELDDLLGSCPGLEILATSRTVLRLRAEHEYPVRPLTVPSSSDVLSIAQASDQSAIRLFFDRAAAVRRDLTATPQNTATVAELCRRLDGVPLAIELAAARSRLLEPAALLDRLETMLDTLGTGPIDLPERQRTLRATVEWSVGLLRADERRLLAVLSVFVDGWTIAAATAVSGETEDRTLDLLDGLVGHSLVSVDAGSTQPRFGMLATVREYGAELLGSSAEGDDVAERHANHFGALGEDGITDAQRPGWIERVFADEENIRAAVRWFFEHEPTRLPHLLIGLLLFWELQDRIREGRAWIRELEERVDLRTLDDHAQAEVLLVAAVTAVEVGDDPGALSAGQAIRPLIDVIEDPALRTGLRLAVAWSLPITDDLDGALASATAAVADAAVPHNLFAAFLPVTMGTLQLALQHDEDARPWLMEAERLGVVVGSEWFTLTARTHLAIIDVRAGRLDAARSLIRQALDETEQSRPVTRTLSFALEAFAHLAVAESQPARAATALGAVDGLRDRAGLLGWPTSRRREAALRAQIAELVDPVALEAAHVAGTPLGPREALGFMREHLAEPR